MCSMLPLGLLVVCAISGSSYEREIAPAPREKSVLKCELRWIGGKGETTMFGKRYTWDTPYAADVTITNNSAVDLDIAGTSRVGPTIYLEIRAKDPDGTEIKAKQGTYLSAKSLEPRPYILKPGEVFRCSVDLLEGIPDKKRVVGTYRAKAVFTFKDKEYESAEVEVKWPVSFNRGWVEVPIKRD